MLKVVSNSSPLICLAKIGHLDLLKYFFDEIIVPEAVYNECVTEGKDKEDAKEIEKAEWIKVATIRDKNLKKALTIFLDEGEAEAIVLALEESADFILLDDYEAREIARNYGLNITGINRSFNKSEIQGKNSKFKRCVRETKRNWILAK